MTDKRTVSKERGEMVSKLIFLFLRDIKMKSVFCSVFGITTYSGHLDIWIFDNNV